MFKASAVLWTVIRGQPIEPEHVVRLHGRASAWLIALLVGSFLIAKFGHARYEHAGALLVIAAAALLYLAVTGLRLQTGGTEAQALLTRHTLLVLGLTLALFAMALGRIVSNPRSRWSPGVLTFATLYACRLCQRTLLADRPATFWAANLHWFATLAAFVTEIAVLVRLFQHLQ